jgi:hypothetical protein
MVTPKEAYENFLNVCSSEEAGNIEIAYYSGLSFGLLLGSKIHHAQKDTVIEEIRNFVEGAYARLDEIQKQIEERRQNASTNT